MCCNCELEGEGTDSDAPVLESFTFKEPVHSRKRAHALRTAPCRMQIDYGRDRTRFRVNTVSVRPSRCPMPMVTSSAVFLTVLTRDRYCDGAILRPSMHPPPLLKCQQTMCHPLSQNVLTEQACFSNTQTTGATNPSPCDGLPSRLVRHLVTPAPPPPSSPHVPRAPALPLKPTPPPQPSAFQSPHLSQSLSMLVTPTLKRM